MHSPVVYGDEPTSIVSEAALPPADCTTEGIVRSLRNLVLSEQGAPVEARQALIDHLKKKKIPAYLKTTAYGDIPVILVNSTTAPQIAEFINHSIGTQATLQPSHSNDHGQFRLENFVIDLDDPGKRGFGEINSSGLAWKPLGSYLAIRDRDPNTNVIMEVAYALRPEELQEAEYYQRMRRAAIIRVPFVLDTVRSDLTLPNTVIANGSSENCFVFCKGMAINNQVNTINDQLHKLGLADVNKFYLDPRTQAFLKQTKEKLLAADPNDQNVLNNRIGDSALNMIAPYFSSVSESTLRNIANWTIGLDASIRYRTMLNGLRVGTDVKAEDINNPRATALLIYDYQAEAPHFNNASYFAQGAGTAGAGVGGPGPWTSSTSDQRPLSTDTVKASSPNHVRLQNKTYTEIPTVTMDSDHTVIENGTRILTGFNEAQPENVTLRTVNRVYHQASNRGVIVGADSLFFQLNTNVYREASALRISKNNSSISISKGSSILVPPNQMMTIDGVFSNGNNGYRVVTTSMKIYQVGQFSYEIASANNIKVGMNVEQGGIQVPIVKIFYNGTTAQLLLKNGTLLPVN
jgi:hypothetical protein